jgi:aminoglycoside phosphotransferase (APT) family kinase protein
MSHAVHPQPDLVDRETLAHVVELALAGAGADAAPLAIVERRPNPHASSFPGEILTCRLAGQGEVRLIYKYAHTMAADRTQYRGNLAYEANVYREVLKPLSLSTARFYGTYTDGATGETWLVLEYLERSLFVHHVEDPAATMVAAARWIGAFHAAGEARLADPSLAFLNRFDRSYYTQLINRARLLVDRLPEPSAWFPAFLQELEPEMTSLLSSSLTVVHGEYYPRNILFRDGQIYPVDWETAAVGPGELDLASLTEGWDEETARECEREYQRARWPEGPPAGFERRLTAARSYWPLRWLGRRAGWSITENCVPLLEQLRVIGEARDHIPSRMPV